MNRKGSMSNLVSSSMVQFGDGVDLIQSKSCTDECLLNCGEQFLSACKELN